MANSFTVNMPLPNALDMLDKGIEDALESAIKDKLMYHAEFVVQQVAANMAKNLKASLKHYEHSLNGDVNIAIVIDGVRQDIDS